MAMRAYSNDLRQRIVMAVRRGDYSLRQLARIFSVSLSCIVRLLQRQRQTGSVQPKPHAGGPTPKLKAHDEARLLELVRQQPDATLSELRDRLGLSCCLMTIARALQRHRITRKKKTRHAEERDTPRVQAQRRQFQSQMASVDPDHLVFVDEAGANTAMTRTYGRAPRGERVPAAVPGHWENVTLITGLRTKGVVAPMTVVGATNREVFEFYVAEVLVPELKPGDVVIWDRLKAHQNPAVIEAVEAVEARVEPLPVYSPDLTPIEELFAKTKEYLRKVAARTTEAVRTALYEALDRVTPSDVLGWFSDRCAYAMPS
jgi:transposase